MTTTTLVKAKTTYKIKPFTEDHKKYSDILLKENIEPVMAELYSLRGIRGFDDINLVQKLEPYSNMKGIKEAAIMLSKAILKKEKICVVADYDVDGATACAIAVRGIKMFGGNIDYVVPDRFIHGYGLQPSVIDEAIIRKNPDMIVTVDNGISSIEGVEYAHKKGLKVLITDHHLPATKDGVVVLPDADVIVNPNQPDCQFQSKSLAGCGVMFYVLAALRQRMIDLEMYTAKTVPNIFSLLDLVAIGTIADVVKLDTNNRIIVKLGLDMIRAKKTRAGVLALIQVAKKQYEQLSTSDIGFGLGPRLNAAGRLEDMTIGINCLLTDNIDTAQKAAEMLDSINQKRKVIETEMKDQALDLKSLSDSLYSKVAYDESFHEGVIGIVASRIKEMFYRPTIVFANAQEEGLIKGSGRSIPEVNLRDALDYVYKKDASLIVKFGGHAMAAGLTIEKKNLEKFNQVFDEAVQHFTEGKDLNNIKEIDMDLVSSRINLETAEHIKDGIWGQGFPHPLFMGEFNIISQKILKDAHLKLVLEKGGQTYEGIWFFVNEPIEENSKKFVYSLGINEFRGNRTVQIMIDGLYD
jgi:single-stranded-DNA-specific exonuclease